MRVDVLRILLRRNRIEIVAAEGLVERVRDVDALDVAVAGDARISGAHLVRQREADRGGTNQEAVLVDQEAGLIVIVERAEIQRVALGEEIAPVEIGGVDLLAARSPAVEAAVGVLLQQVEVRQVVLEDVVVKVAEEARAGLFVAEDEAAEIAGEALDAHAERGEIEVRLAGEEALLDEQFLHADGGIGAVRAGAHVDGEQSVLAREQRS